MTASLSSAGTLGNLSWFALKYASASDCDTVFLGSIFCISLRPMIWCWISVRNFSRSLSSVVFSFWSCCRKPASPPNRCLISCMALSSSFATSASLAINPWRLPSAKISFSSMSWFRIWVRKVSTVWESGALCARMRISPSCSSTSLWSTTSSLTTAAMPSSRCVWAVADAANALAICASTSHFMSLNRASEICAARVRLTGP